MPLSTTSVITSPDDHPFYVVTDDATMNSSVHDFRDHHLVQSFTNSELAVYYAQVLNRLWKEGKLK